MESHSLSWQGTLWQSERGSTAVWVPSPTVLVVAFQGHGEARFAKPIIEAFDKLSKGPLIHLFFDAEGLTNYDSPLRIELTARFRPDRRRLGSLLVLVRSKLVAMGASVANLALGGIVSSTTERTVFKAKLDACLLDSRVIGFSSNALDALRVRSADAGGG